MNADSNPEVDWRDWLQRWDRQQEGYVPEREVRFTAVLDAVEQLLPESFVALDLACGPGSISQRLLARFPGARAVAVDMDPAMLALGQGALGTFEGRLRWIKADLAAPDWLKVLGERQIDVVLSTTSLHWLWPDTLDRVYHDLARLLRPGGAFLNGDHLAYGPTSPTLARLNRSVSTSSGPTPRSPGVASRLRSSGGTSSGRNRRWRRSWLSVPDCSKASGAKRLRPASTYTCRRCAGPDLPEVGTIWQMLSNRVLLAVRRQYR
ncbi:MAG: class I SAM-dependent methyltransferase [Sciscionella sp.]